MKPCMERVLSKKRKVKGTNRRGRGIHGSEEKVVWEGDEHSHATPEGGEEASHQPVRRVGSGPPRGPETMEASGVLAAQLQPKKRKEVHERSGRSV